MSDSSDDVVRFPIEQGHVRAFALAIGETSPVYLDADDPETVAVGGLLAPPTFTVASLHHEKEHAFRPRPGVPWHGSGREASGVPAGPGGATTLHAEQHFTYHAPVHVGDVLTLTTSPGRTWEKHGGSGRLAFAEMITEHHNQHGELVVTATITSVTLHPVPTDQAAVAAEATV